MTTVNGQAVTGPLGRFTTRITTSESDPVEVARWSADPHTVTRVRWNAVAKRVDADGGDVIIGGAAIIREAGDARAVADGFSFTVGLPFEMVQAGDDATACVLRVPATTGVFLVDFEVTATSLTAEA